MEYSHCYFGPQALVSLWVPQKYDITNVNICGSPAHAEFCLGRIEYKEVILPNDIWEGILKPWEMVTIVWTARPLLAINQPPTIERLPLAGYNWWQSKCIWCHGFGARYDLKSG